MKKARLLDTPEDYQNLGISPDEIEVWEDGRRNMETGKGNWEWWYFDAIFDNGVKAVIQFFTKAGMMNIQKEGDVPSVTIKITTPDGKCYQEEVKPRLSECSFASEKCDVQIGKCSVTGDFKKYVLHLEGKKIQGDLELISRGTPYRPGTGYFAFGDDEYYTWLCSVPHGDISGTLTYGGKTETVTGKGYHDHQWGNRFYLPEWNNWLWARQSFDDYSILTFDFVASEENDYQRFPIMFIQDKEGRIIFENRHDVKCSVPEVTPVDRASGKIYPKTVCYEYEKDGQKVRYELESQEILESQGVKSKPIIGKLIVRKLGMNLSYMRFLGTGKLTIDDGKAPIERSGELIYEFMYPGEDAITHMEQKSGESSPNT